MSAAMDLDMDGEPDVLPSTSSINTKTNDMEVDSPNGSPAPPVPPKAGASTRTALSKSFTEPAVLPSSSSSSPTTATNTNGSPSKAPRPKLHSFFDNIKPRNLNRDKSSSLISLPKQESRSRSPNGSSSRRKKHHSSRDPEEDDVDAALLDVKGTSRSNYNQHNYFGPQAAREHQAESLSAYVSAGFRWTLLLTGLWAILTILRALVDDISERMAATSLQSRSALHECSRHFEQNCMPPSISEWALREGLCDDWRVCMEKDPRMVGRAKIAAEILAEMIDAFVGGMGWKTLGFLLAVAAVLASFSSPGKSSLAAPPPQPAPYPPSVTSPPPPDYGLMMMSPQAQRTAPFTPHRSNTAPPNAYFAAGHHPPSPTAGKSKGWFG